MQCATGLRQDVLPEGQIFRPVTRNAKVSKQRLSARAVADIVKTMHDKPV